jgi:hypothetical protein
MVLVDSAFIGASTSTLRCRTPGQGKNEMLRFYFQVIHLESLPAGRFATGDTPVDNVTTGLVDIVGHKNEARTLVAQ